jgi:hypothetical protein
MTIFKRLSYLFSTLLVLGACSGGSDGGHETEIADAIGLIAESVEVTGSGLEGGASGMMAQRSRGGLSVSPMAVTPFTSDLCDEHGRPQDGSGNDLNQADEAYPFIHTYCALTINDGDTVRGGFDLTRGLVCMLEKGGIEFEGVAQTITVDMTDDDCWPNGAPDTDGTTSFDITATGSAPASFNSHFEKGVVFEVGEFGLTFSIGANLDGEELEFIGMESWDEGNKGVMSGAFNQSTGVLRFEKRDERIRADCTTSDCGWNRHTRIYAQLELDDDGEPVGLENFSYGYADTAVDAADPTAATQRGTIVTAQGSLTGEIKARLYTASNKTAAQLMMVGQWSETANTACADADGIDDGGDCTTETGVDLFAADTDFALYSADFASSEDWLADFSGFDAFTEIDLDTDLAFN